MPRGRMAQGMLKSSGAAGGPRDAGGGEGGVPVVPLGNPTPGSNVGRLNLQPPPPPHSAAGGEHLGAAPAAPCLGAWIQTPPARGSLCPTDDGSLLLRFQSRKKRTFYSSGWEKKDPPEFLPAAKSRDKAHRKGREGGIEGRGRRREESEARRVEEEGRGSYLCCSPHRRPQRPLCRGAGLEGAGGWRGGWWDGGMDGWRQRHSGAPPNS